MSFTVRTSMFITTVVAVIMMIVNAVVYSMFQNWSMEQKRNLMDADLGRISEKVKDVNSLPLLLTPGLGGAVLGPNLQAMPIDLKNGQALLLARSDGKILGKSINGFDESIIGDVIDGKDRMVTSGGDTVYRAQTVVTLPYYGQSTLVLLENDASFEQPVKTIGLYLTIGTLASVALTAVGSWFVARRTIRPVARIIGNVEAIDVAGLEQRLQLPKQHDEIRRLTETFNRLLERISEGFRQQRRFVADASHELKTPIAVIEGHARLLDRWGKESREVLDESLSYILAETRRMKHLTEQLLLSAHLEEEGEDLQGEADLTAVVDEVVRQSEQVNPRVAVNYDAMDTHSLMVRMPEVRVHQIVRNIVENALKYTPDGGSVRISIDESPDTVELLVEDTGIGIPEEELPHIFDRFYRVDPSRSRGRGGSGLGLSITKRILDQYGATVSIQSKLGEGTSVRIGFPALNQGVITKVE